MTRAGFDEFSARLLHQLRQFRCAIAVEHVESAEGDDVAAGEDVMRAALHHSPYIKIVHVQERCDGDAQHVSRTDRLSSNLLQEVGHAISVATGCV